MSNEQPFYRIVRKCCRGAWIPFISHRWPSCPMITKTGSQKTLSADACYHMQCVRRVGLFMLCTKINCTKAPLQTLGMMLDFRYLFVCAINIWARVLHSIQIVRETLTVIQMHMNILIFWKLVFWTILPTLNQKKPSIRPSKSPTVRALGINLSNIIDDSMKRKRTQPMQFSKCRRLAGAVFVSIIFPLSLVLSPLHFHSLSFIHLIFCVRWPSYEAFMLVPIVHLFW